MSIVMDRPRAGSASAKPRPKARRNNPLLGKAAVNGFLIVVTLYMMMPCLWLIIAATKDQSDQFAVPGFAVGDVNLIENVKAVFTTDNGIFPRWLANSFLYSVVGSFIGTAISVLAGYAFDKYEFPFKEKWFGFILLGVLVPSTATALPLYLLFAEVGLLNTYWAVLLPSLVNPFGVYLARVFSEGYVPKEIIEAARVDGAGELKIFFRVALPMLTPGFATIFLFSFTGSWNNFFTPLIMLSNSELYPVTLGIYSWNSVTSQQLSYVPVAITGSLITVLPLVLAFISLQRFWRSGLTAGAVK